MSMTDSRSRPVDVRTLSQEQYQALPRVAIDMKRAEDATGILWLTDGSRVRFSCRANGPTVRRVEGVVDATGGPVYEIDWSIQANVKAAG